MKELLINGRMQEIQDKEISYKSIFLRPGDIFVLRRQYCVYVGYSVGATARSIKIAYNALVPNELHRMWMKKDLYEWTHINNVKIPPKELVHLIKNPNQFSAKTVACLKEAASQLLRKEPFDIEDEINSWSPEKREEFNRRAQELINKVEKLLDQGGSL